MYATDISDTFCIFPVNELEKLGHLTNKARLRHSQQENFKRPSLFSTNCQETRPANESKLDISELKAVLSWEHYSMAGLSTNYRRRDTGQLMVGF